MHYLIKLHRVEEFVRVWLLFKAQIHCHYLLISGLHLAEVSLFLSIARVLASMDIKKPIDTSGREIDPDITYTGNLVS
jgi:hypothetical protein